MSTPKSGEQLRIRDTDVYLACNFTTRTNEPELETRAALKGPPPSEPHGRASQRRLVCWAVTRHEDWLVSREGVDIAHAFEASAMPLEHSDKAGRAGRSMEARRALAELQLACFVAHVDATKMLGFSCGGSARGTQHRPAGADSQREP